MKSLLEYLHVKNIKASMGDYVDLGLPSGTLWATCNMGASKPEETGDLFSYKDAVFYKNLPKRTQFQELIDHCSWEKTTSGGKSLFIVTGPNGEKLVFPSTGSYQGPSTPIFCPDDVHIWGDGICQLYINNDEKHNFAKICDPGHGVNVKYAIRPVK